MVNNSEMWCSCVQQRVKHEYIGLRDFGWAVMEVYRCKKCGALKCFPTEEGEIYKGPRQLCQPPQN
jgi:hypothetical protein